jgi:hypothetical protein
MLATLAGIDDNFSGFFSHVMEYITVNILLSSKNSLDLLCTL